MSPLSTSVTLRRVHLYSLSSDRAFDQAVFFVIKENEVRRLGHWVGCQFGKPDPRLYPFVLFHFWAEMPFDISEVSEGLLEEAITNFVWHIIYCQLIDFPTQLSKMQLKDRANGDGAVSQSLL